MSRTAFAAALLLATVAAPSAAPAAELFSIPGVIDNRDLGTFVLCTSTDTDGQTIDVEAIDKNGNVAGSGRHFLRPGRSVMFGTRAAQGLDVDVLLRATTISKGTATISSTSSLLTCSAFIADSAHSTPLFGVALNVIANGVQKGH